MRRKNGEEVKGIGLGGRLRLARFSPGGGIILSFGRNANRDARATAGTESAAIYIKPDPSTIATFYSYTRSGGVSERVVADVACTRALAKAM